MSENTFPAMLRRLSSRVTPATVIDVGASDGRWSRMAMGFWPKARYQLIEADERHYPALGAFCEEDPFRRRSTRAMVGGKCGVGFFSADPNDPWGGQGHTEEQPGSVAKEQVTIDLMAWDQPCPLLIKLDTHGFEGPILEGATKTLENACAVIIEAYTCALQPGALQFWELCQYMAGFGFACTDMADPLRRPLDGRLWQMDLLFERLDAPMVGEPRYK